MDTGPLSMEAALQPERRTTRLPLAAPLRFLRRLATDPRGAGALTVLFILLVFGFIIPLVVTTSPFESVRGERLLHPSWKHPFGTDELSRDLFIRNAIGFRSTLLSGLFAVVGGWLVGISLGYTAGYRGGLADTLISRSVDTLLAFPGILLAVLLIAWFGPGLTSLSLAIAIFNIPFSTRLARAAVLREIVRDYVLAAQTIGCSGSRVLLRHVSINTFGVFAVQLPIAIVNSILIIAALGFLGLGEQPPNPTLGGLLFDGRRFMRLAWWYLLAPASIVAVFMLSLNFLSDVLSEMLDPVRRGRG
ncbi:MAG: ABC transporter permease [Dehalococcoidia bacterium]|nr:ABC transporter permease [Dehalococcoidia bacterium]